AVPTGTEWPPRCRALPNTPVRPAQSRCAPFPDFGSHTRRRGGGVPVLGRPAGELLGECRATDLLASDHKDGVVTSDGANDFGQPGAVQRAGQVLRGA